MKKIILSKVKDNRKFKLKRYSDVIYIKVKKITGPAVVITSCSSGRSFEKKGKTKVWVD